jgi:hypothetical protein
MVRIYGEVTRFLATPRLRLPYQLEKQVLKLYQTLKQFPLSGDGGFVPQSPQCVAAAEANLVQPELALTLSLTQASPPASARTHNHEPAPSAMSDESSRDISQLGAVVNDRAIKPACSDPDSGVHARSIAAKSVEGGWVSPARSALADEFTEHSDDDDDNNNYGDNGKGGGRHEEAEKAQEDEAVEARFGRMS